MKKIGILKGFDNYYQNYVKACEELGVPYEIIDVISDNWIESIKKSECAGFLHRPPCDSYTRKEGFDSKLYFINFVMGREIYPDFLASYIYESKKNMYYWLKINNIPHAETHVFYDKDNAINFVNSRKEWPIIFKPNLGSGAQGIKIIKTKRAAKRLINRVFRHNGFFVRGFTPHQKIRFGLSMPVQYNKQVDFLEFQNKIDVKYEWRMIHINGSFFGHQKLANKGFHSGSGLVGWVEPPKALLDFVKSICELGKFDSMDVDIFESSDGKYFVNELQTIFGSYNPSQMYIDGKPGRFRFINGEWVFEEGYFCQNASNNLRVESFAKKLKIL